MTSLSVVVTAGQPVLTHLEILVSTTLPQQHYVDGCKRVPLTEPISVTVRIGEFEQQCVFPPCPPNMRQKQKTEGCVCLVLTPGRIESLSIRLDKVPSFLALHHANLVDKAQMNVNDALAMLEHAKAKVPVLLP